MLFEVSPDSANMQLNIDLAVAPAATTPLRHDDCKCEPGVALKASNVPPTLSPSGYVVFYVSQGEGGYSVEVSGPDGKPSFDSTGLLDGDLFALSLLAPTTYAMTNAAGKARGTIEVGSVPSELARNLSSVETVYVDASTNQFTPASVSVVSGQGIVFRIKEPSRIVIEQMGEPKDGRPPASRRLAALRPPLRRRSAGS